MKYRAASPLKVNWIMCIIHQAIRFMWPKSFRPNHIIFKPPGSEEMMREVVMKVESMQEKLYEFEVLVMVD